MGYYRRRKREWSTSEGKGEVDRERERLGMSGSCGSELMEEGSELLDVDRSRRCWVLVCDLNGAWMNRALTVVWRGRGWRFDRHDCGFDGAISLSVCASMSSSFSLSFSLCVSPKMVWSENNNGKYFTPRCLYFTVNTENIFSLTQFSVTTKYPLLRKSISRSGLKPKQKHP